MASRRSRLKAVANLPIRKKSELKEETVGSSKVIDDVTEIPSVVVSENIRTECVGTANENNRTQIQGEDNVDAESISKSLVNSQAYKSTKNGLIIEDSDIASKEGVELEHTESVKVTKIVNLECEEASNSNLAVSRKLDVNNQKDATQGSGLKFGRRIKPVVSIQARKQPKSGGTLEDKRVEESVSKNNESHVLTTTNEINSNVSDQTSHITNSNDTVKENVLLTTKTTENIETPKSLSLKDAPEIESINPPPIVEINAVIRDRGILSSLDNGSSASTVNNEKETSEVKGTTISRIPQSPVKNIQRPRFVRPTWRAIESSPRRPSVHASSASESEDDSRRPLHSFSPSRLRKISESSASGKSFAAPIVIPKDQGTDVKPVDDKSHFNVTRSRKSRVNHLGRRLAEARREFNLKHDKTKPVRSKLTMFDLIFYNPASNPMESKMKEEKKEIIKEELADSELVDDPREMDIKNDSSQEDNADYGGMPVPQVKIGPNGELILDEKSLVIETTEAKRGREDLLNSVPIFEDKNSNVSYYNRRTKRTRDWTDAETKRFYKALKTVGTDFLVMQTLFPNRTRLELKKKFKREEKVNRFLIDKALNHPAEFDTQELELEVLKELEEKEVKDMEKVKIKKEKRREKDKSSPLLKEMVDCIDEKEIKQDETDSQPGNTDMKAKRKADKENDITMLCNAVDMTNDPSVSLSVENLYKKQNSTSRKSVITYKSFKKKQEERSTKSDRHEPVENIDHVLNSVKDKKMHKRKNEDESQVKRKVLESEKSTKRKRNVWDHPKQMDIVPEVEDDVEFVDDDTDTISVDNSCSSDTMTLNSTEEFLKLLTHNINNFKETTIKLQLTDDSTGNCTVICEDVPPITYEEIINKPVTVFAEYGDKYESSDIGLVAGGIKSIEDVCPTLNENDVLTANSSESPTTSSKNDENDVTKNRHSQSIGNNHSSVIVENPALKNKDSTNSVPNHHIFYSDHTYVSVIKTATDSSKTEYEITKEKTCESISDETSDSNVPVSTTQSGSFVFFATESDENPKQKEFKMYATSKDGSTKLMPAFLPQELIQALAAEAEEV